LINFVDATNDANQYTKPPPRWLFAATWIRDVQQNNNNNNSEIMSLNLCIKEVQLL